MFPGDPFQKYQEKLDRKFTELCQHIDNLLEATNELKNTVTELTAEIKHLTEALKKKSPPQ